MTPAEELRNFIIHDMEWRGNPDDLTPDYDLISNGVIDSLGLLTLFSFMEDRFDVKVELKEFTAQNLETIGAMVAFIERKRASIR